MRLGVIAQSIRAIVWDTLDPNRGLIPLFQTGGVSSSKVGLILCIVEKVTILWANHQVQGWAEEELR